MWVKKSVFIFDIFNPNHYDPYSIGYGRGPHPLSGLSGMSYTMNAHFMVPKEETPYIGEALYNGTSFEIVIVGLFPSVQDLIRFCDLRKELFGENLNFKIMYSDAVETRCGEAIYSAGKVRKNVTLDSWALARTMAYGGRNSNLSLEMTMRAQDWLGAFIQEILDEIEEEEERARIAEDEKEDLG